MRKTALTAAAIAVATLFAGGAMAGPDETGNPGKGNQGCGLPNFDVWKNPGKLFQFERETRGENPAEFIRNNDFVFDPEPESVGEYIPLICDRPS
jgi:hypothetical protein